MKNIFSILFIGLILTSCSNDNEDNVVVDTHVLLKYIDQNGNNILDQANGIISSNIKVYHKVNNQWIEQNNTNMDNPQGFSVLERNSEKYLKLFPSHNFYDANFSETKIQYSESELAIVKTQFDLSNENIICTKVWYNGNLKWEDNETERLIEIRK